MNGIDATANGKTLVIVQSGTGRLFTVTPAGVAKAIALADGESVPNGDGILLDGRTLYVVQNQLNDRREDQPRAGPAHGTRPPTDLEPGLRHPDDGRTTTGAACTS